MVILSLDGILSCLTTKFTRLFSVKDGGYISYFRDVLSDKKLARLLVQGCYSFITAQTKRKGLFHRNGKPHIDQIVFIIMITTITLADSRSLPNECSRIGD